MLEHVWNFIGNCVWTYYGEILVLGIVGVLLALVRRILFGKLCQDVSRGSNGNGRMQKAMTLRFEKSYEVNVGIPNIPVFVRKYLCQERRFRIRLERWRRLPERWTGLILGVGFLEAVVLRYLKYEEIRCLDRFLAAMTMAVLVWMACLIFESDSLWEQTQILLLDYVSNTLYPRQIHEYEGFEAESMEERTEPESNLSETKEAAKGFALKKEEEQIFTEVLADFLGTST
jgi:hypothetical protein